MRLGTYVIEIIWAGGDGNRSSSHLLVSPFGLVARRAGSWMNVNAPATKDVLELGSERHVYAESILNSVRIRVESPLACVSGIRGADR